MVEQSLKDKTVKGVTWSGIDNIAHYAVTFVISIVLARLLSPDDYGLLGLIGIFPTICSVLIDGGVTSALIRKKDATEIDYNTVFIIHIIMSTLLYSVFFFASPLIAHFFEREELIALTRISTLGFIIGAFSSVQHTRLIKRIDFKTQTKITVMASVSSGLIGIVLALLHYGVWALVAQSLSLLIIKTVLLWISSDWKPKLLFSIVSFKEMFGFGWKLMVSQLLNDTWKELYQLVVGKFYSPATLGQYTRAKGFSQLLSKNLTSVVQRVTYPVLSEIQDDKERLIKAYRRIIKTTIFISAVSMLLLSAISEPLLFCLIGPKWHMAAIYLPLICISSSLYPLQSINLNMLKVQGRSDLFLGLEIVKKIIGLLPLFVGAFVGIMPMLYVNLITTGISFFINSYYSGKLIGYSSWMQIIDVLPSYGVAFFVAISVYFLKYLPISNWVILPMQLILGGIVFIVFCKITKIEEYQEMKVLLSPIINKVLKR